MRMLYIITCSLALLLASDDAVSGWRNLKQVSAVNKIVTAVKANWTEKALTLVSVSFLTCNMLACDRGEELVTTEPIPVTEMVGDMLMVGFHGTAIDQATQQMFAAVQPGGVILYDSGGEQRNIVSPQQTAQLTAATRILLGDDVLIAVDAEGGYVNRLKTKHGFTVEVPTAQKLGAGTPAATQAIAARLAQQMRAVGLNINLAPVVDININPTSPAIGKYERAFSHDPAIVIAHARAFIAGHREHGVLTALKHFPGHGSATGDTHIGITDITATYQRELELLPYQTLIQEGYHWPVMIAHVIERNLDVVPATLSPAIVTVLLRDRLGFEGVVISDDMQMGAIVQEYQLDKAIVMAVQAGVDIVLLAGKSSDDHLGDVYRARDAILQAVQDGSISELDIETAWIRIKELKEQL